MKKEVGAQRLNWYWVLFVFYSSVPEENAGCVPGGITGM